MFSEKEQLAWAAGLFEGEGSMYLVNKHPRIELTSTDKDIVERFLEIINVGKIQERAKPPYKTAYRWYVQDKTGVEKVISLLMPYLGERRTEKALELLEFAKRRKTVTSEHKGVYWHKTAGKWVAQASKGYAKFHLGVFDTEEEAVAALKQWQQ